MRRACFAFDGFPRFLFWLNFIFLALSGAPVPLFFGSVCWLNVCTFGASGTLNRYRSCQGRPPYSTFPHANSCFLTDRDMYLSDVPEAPNVQTFNRHADPQKRGIGSTGSQDLKFCQKRKRGRPSKAKQALLVSVSYTHLTLPTIYSV